MRHLWQDWAPRVADYWASFSAPYRQRVTELVDRYTPEGGSVMDFGCGVGVQTFLIRQRRPDVTIYAIDVNAHARNLTRVLCGDDPRLHVEDTPVVADLVHPVDTVFSVFACAYLEPAEIGKVLTALHQKSKVMILAEPTTLEDAVHAYAGMPTVAYAYPYGFWFERWGDTVTTEPLDTDGFPNAITVVVKAAQRDPDAVEMTLEYVP